MRFEKLYSLYDVAELSGIDQETLAGVIEEHRLDAVLVSGDYRITKSAFEKWAADILDRM